MKNLVLHLLKKGHENMNNTKKLTDEQKAARAAKAKATRAANKAKWEQKDRERAEMLALMKQLVQLPELDANRRADLILEIREMEGTRRSSYSHYPRMPYIFF